MNIPDHQLKHKNAVPLILTLIIFLFYLSLYIIQKTLITEDGTLWISYGLQIFQGDLHSFQFEGGAPSFSPLVFSPGYPFLVGLVNEFIQDPIFSAYLISMVMGALLCLVVFHISKNLFNKKIGYISLLLCGVYTGMKHYAVSTWIRSTGMFFLLLGLYLFLRCLRKEGMVYPLLTGTTLGVALLVRFEFALYAILAAVLFLFYVVRRRLKVRSLVCFSVALVIVYSLYAIPLYLFSGYKILSPYISEKFLGEKMPDKPRLNDYSYTGLTFRTVLFNQNTALCYNLSKQNKVKVSKEDWEKYGAQEDGPSTRSEIFDNYKYMFQRIIPLLFKWHIVGFFLLGIYYSIRRRKSQSFGLCALIGITLLFFPLGSIETIRYYHHLQPLILIIASCGVYFVAETAKNKLKTGAVFYAVIAVVLSLYFWNDVTKSLQTSYKQQELVWLEAAEYLKENAEENSIVIARNNFPAFYSHLRMVMLPTEQDIKDVWEYSNHIGADWFIIDKQLTDKLMPQYGFLLEEVIPDFLELKKELFKGTEYFTRIFKIKHGSE